MLCPSPWALLANLVLCIRSIDDLPVRDERVRHTGMVTRTLDTHTDCVGRCMCVVLWCVRMDSSAVLRCLYINTDNNTNTRHTSAVNGDTPPHPRSPYRPAIIQHSAQTDRQTDRPTIHIARASVSHRTHELHLSTSTTRMRLFTCVVSGWVTTMPRAVQRTDDVGVRTDRQ